MNNVVFEIYDFDLENWQYKHFEDIDDSDVWWTVEHLCETKDFFSLKATNMEVLKEYLKNMELAMSIDSLKISANVIDDKTLYSTETLVYSDFGLLSVREFINRCRTEQDNVIEKMFLYAEASGIN